MNKNAAAHNTKILIVDDEKSIRITLGEFLKDENYYVEVAEDADLALDILSKKIFDIVLTDIIMPRTTGISLLKAIKETSPDVQVILMTGEPTVETASAAVRTNAFDYLTKPIVKEDLLKTVANAISFKLINDERNQLQEENQNYQKNLEKLVEERTKALQISEKFQKTIFETTALPTCILEEDTTISAVNIAFEIISGYSKEEIEEKKSWTEFVGKEDLKRMKEYHQQRRNDPGSAKNQYEFEFINRKGDIRNILLNVSLIPGTKKSVASFLDITERKQSEQLLLVNEKRYKKAQSMGHVGNWEYNPKTEMFWGSDEAKRIYGFDLDNNSFSTENVEGCIPERERVHQALIDLVENDKEYDLVFDILTYDKGVRKTIHSIAETQRDAEGNVIKVTGVISDITKQKQLEEERNARLNLLRIAGQSAKFGGWSVDLLSNTQVWSDEVSDIHETPRGYNPSISEGTNFYTPEYKDKIKKVFDDCAKKGIPYDEEMQIVTKTGKKIWIRTIGEPVKDRDGNIIKVKGSFQDINDRKIAEQELIQTKEQYRSIVEDSPGLIVRFSPDRRITFANQGYCEFFRKELDELIGKDLLFTMTKDEKEALWSEINSLTPESPIYISESENVNYAGEVRNLRWIDRALFDAKGRVRNYQSFGQDITRQFRSQQFLNTLNQAFVAMAAALTHDDLFNVIAEELNKIDVDCMVFTINESKSKLIPRYVSLDSKTLKTLEKMLGKSRDEFQLLIETVDLYKQVLWEKKTIFSDDSKQVLLSALPDFAKKLAPRINKLLNIKKSITTPILVKGQAVGLFSIQSNNLSPDDLGAAKAFADQLSSAWSNVSLLNDLRDTVEGTIQTIAATVESRDPYTAGHQKRVSDLATAIAIEMNLANDQTEGIKMAGIIHDLGKIGIPAEILSKPGKISDMEYKLIKTHPQNGYKLIKEIKFPWPIAQIVLQHHEKMDGSGYPQGLKGDEIMIEAKILTVADIVEAMSSHRPYRPALGIERALAQIKQEKGTLLDEKVVEACLNVFENGYELPDM